MAKILTKSEFASLKQSADNYDTVVQAILKMNNGLKAEDVTVEVILEALQANGDDDPSAELTQQLADANTRIAELESENQNLKDSAAEDTTGVDASGGEPGGEKESLTAFADKNKGNTAAILEAAANDGFI